MLQEDLTGSLTSSVNSRAISGNDSACLRWYLELESSEQTLRIRMRGESCPVQMSKNAGCFNHEVVQTSSAANLSTAVNGVFSGTPITLKGRRGSLVRVILKVTLALATGADMRRSLCGSHVASAFYLNLWPLVKAFSMSIIYACVAHKDTILAEHSTKKGNFTKVVKVILEKISPTEGKMTYTFEQ